MAVKCSRCAMTQDGLTRNECSNDEDDQGKQDASLWRETARSVGQLALCSVEIEPQQRLYCSSTPATRDGLPT